MTKHSETMPAKEAAVYLGISKWLLYESVKRKEIPCVRIGGRLLFRKAALDEWMSLREKESLERAEKIQQIK